MHVQHIRAVLVDVNVLFRAGLRELLEHNGIAVVGEAASAEEGLQTIERCGPDVVVIEPELPDMPAIDSCEAVRRIKESAPATHVLVLARATSEQDAVDIVCMGGSGFLLKEAPPGTILAGVRAAAAGEALIAPKVAASLVRRLRASGAGERPQPRSVLSEREQEVLCLIAAGKDNDEIASELFISRHTVKNHISSILLKLEVTNRVQAAVLAVRTAMV